MQEGWQWAENPQADQSSSKARKNVPCALMGNDSLTVAQLLAWVLGPQLTTNLPLSTLPTWPGDLEIWVL